MSVAFGRTVIFSRYSSRSKRDIIDSGIHIYLLLPNITDWTDLVNGKVSNDKYPRKISSAELILILHVFGVTVDQSNRHNDKVIQSRFGIYHNRVYTNTSIHIITGIFNLVLILVLYIFTVTVTVGTRISTHAMTHISNLVLI